MRLQRCIVAWLWGVAACGHPHALPEAALAELYRAAEPPEAPEERVYEGSVYPRGAEETLLYRYERRVVELGEGLRSSHVTRAPAGEPVVLHQAEHSPTYDLTGFREIHAQTGLVGQVDVGLDGTATYQTTVGGHTRTRTEAPGDPLQAGPTLFGYVLERWEPLVAGETIPVRFVVLSRRRSYRFELRRIEGPVDTITFELVPTSRFVALSVPPTRLVFDEERNILRYTGLVPPLEEVGRRLERLDATVTYAHTSETYR